MVRRVVTALSTARFLLSHSAAAAVVFVMATAAASSAAAAAVASSSSSSGLLLLAGQRVLVTGSGRGIGRAIALVCHNQGAKVALSSRTRSELEETAALMRKATTSQQRDEGGSRPPDGDDIHIAQADVTDDAQVNEMVDSIVRKWGGIDVLVNNAGASQASKGPCQSLPSDDLERLLRVNVVAVHRVTAAVLNRAMPKDGRIVMISSRAAKIGIANNSFYVASKFALEGLAASLAIELADRNIEVNTLSPGMVDTRSFPKPPGRKGVRAPEAVADGLMAVLESGLTGRYLHVDELDTSRQRGLPDSVALKPIHEPTFDP